MADSNPAGRSASGAALIVLTSTIVALVTVAISAELGVRSVAPDVLPKLNRPLPHTLPAALVEPDAELGQRFRANATQFFTPPHKEFSVDYRINEVGLRDAGIFMPGAQWPLVLVVGDDYAEGWGVMTDATFIQEVQRRLRPRDGIDERMRLLNGGMSGYGARQTELHTRALMARYKFDAILFVYSSLMPAADARFSAQRQNAEAMESSGSRSDTGLFYDSAFFHLMRSMLAARSARAAIQPGDPATDIFAAARGDATAETLSTATLAHVRELAEYARSNDTPFILLHVPLPHHVAADEWDKGREAFGFEARLYPAPDTAGVETLCRELRIECIMSGPLLRQRAEESASRLYFRYDYALTPAGHRLLVAPVLDAIYRAVKKG